MDVDSIVEPWLWTGFAAGILILLLLDLFVLHREGRAASIGKAIGESALWIGVALAFNGWFAWAHGTDAGLQFLTAYIVEKSLSIDNVFVILLIFNSFRIPLAYQHRALFWGVFGAIVLRALLIIVGASLVHRFHWILYVFGLILIASGLRFLFSSEAEEEIADHWAVKLLKHMIPLAPELHGSRFFVRTPAGWAATPLFVALLVIEVSDLIFAVDSIPAVLAITQDSFIAFASNILAVLGLRALYFVIADFIARFRYLKPGLAAILCFVGVKMLMAAWFTIPSWVSLLVIVMVLLTAGLSSWYAGRKELSAYEPSPRDDELG